MTTDVHDTDTRSKNMRAIGPKDTKPEKFVRSYLHRAGFRYTLHDTKLAGKPDIVLPKWAAVVFVHGCFWHRHPGCRYATTPKARNEFWLEKLEANRRRDLRHQEALERDGWRVFVIWECQLKNEHHLTNLVSNLRGVA